MSITRKTLLERVKQPGDEQAWDEFYGLYAPLLYRYARSLGASTEDALEVRDRCLEVLVRRLPDFDYDRNRGSFQGFLHRIVRGVVIDLRRGRRAHALDTDQWYAMPDEQLRPDQVWERTWLHGHLLYCLREVEAQLPPLTVKAFRMLLLEDADVKAVSRELGLTPNQVYKAKARVLGQVRRRLRSLGLAGELEQEFRIP